MNISADGKVSMEELWRIVSSSDPRKAVMKVIEQLHKDLAEIQKQMDKAKQEEKLKLRAVEERIKEAIAVLKTGGNLDLAADQLAEIKVLDPKSYELIRPQLQVIQERADELRRLRAKTVAIPGAGMIA